MLFRRAQVVILLYKASVPVDHLFHGLYETFFGGEPGRSQLTHFRAMRGWMWCAQREHNYA
jgi:hypothetical protein